MSRAPLCAAVLESVQDFFGFVDLSGLIIENTQGRIAARPLWQQIHRTGQLIGGLRSVAFQG